MTIREILGMSVLAHGTRQVQGVKWSKDPKTGVAIKTDEPSDWYEWIPQVIQPGTPFAKFVLREAQYKQYTGFFDGYSVKVQPCAMESAEPIPEDKLNAVLVAAGKQVQAIPYGEELDSRRLEWYPSTHVYATYIGFVATAQEGQTELNLEF